MDLVKHVDQALNKAVRAEPELPKWILDITGFSTPTMRRFFNAICHGKFNYCEVGVYAGGTFFSAVHGNENLSAVGFEDFSQPFGATDIKIQLHKNLIRIDLLQADVIESDFFSWKGDHRLFDIFFYDGNHDYENQYRALPFFYKNLAESFIYIVDDYNWPVVCKATTDSITYNGLTVDHQWTLVGNRLNDDPMWHNGLFIAVCTKK